MFPGVQKTRIKKMASIQTIAKAKTTGLILKNLLGIEPEYQYFDNYVRLYYPAENLPKVQDKINQIAVNSSKPGDVRIDFFPIVAPVAIKKVAPYAIGAIVAGYLLGKML